jgi:hypothetical protein
MHFCIFVDNKCKLLYTYAGLEKALLLKKLFISAGYYLKYKRHEICYILITGERLN